MNNGKIFSINGPVIKGRNMTDFTAKEMVLIGEKKLIGEVISLEDDIAAVSYTHLTLPTILLV